MNKYEYLFKSLNFNKVGDSYVLETFTDNNLSFHIMIASNGTGYDRVSKNIIENYDKLRKYLDDTESYKSIKSITIKDLEQNRLQDQLNINIIYDGGNSEYTMPFEKNFDIIFLETLRENRDKKLNSIL
jgi:hypothetical protein